MAFNGFISYSHAADGQLAPALQRGLHRLAKPWHRRQALWIFRDQTGLSVTPKLWTSIQKALDDSDYFILMSSPGAASSPWVNREVEHWIAHKSADRILPVLTAGTWTWDAERRDFTADSTAVPDSLRGVFTEEPRHLDLRWARDDHHLTLRHARFRDAVAQLAAPMHGVSKDRLESEDLRHHRRAVRVRWLGLATLMFLATVALGSGILAAHNSDRADLAREEGRQQQHVAQVQRQNAERASQEAQRQQASAKQQRTIAGIAAEEAHRQQANARAQRANAERAAAQTKRQEELSRQQQQLARHAAAEARSQQELANRYRASANQAQTKAKAQKRLADLAAADAKRQADIAEGQRRVAAAATERAQRQQRIAAGQHLLNQAKAAFDGNPAMALRLGLAATAVQPGDATERPLAGMVASTRYRAALPDAWEIATSRDGLLVTHDGNGHLSVWRATDPSKPVALGVLDLGSRESRGISISADGRRVAVGLTDTVVICDLADNTHPRELGRIPKTAASWPTPTLSPDGRMLAIDNRDATVGLWDVGDPGNPRLFSTLAAPGVSGDSRFAFSPDGRSIAVSNTDVVIWDLQNPVRPVAHPPLPLDEQSRGHITALAFSPRDKLLAIGALAQMTLWAVGDPDQPVKGQSRPYDKKTRSGIAFSADGHLLAGGVNADSDVALWLVKEPRELVLVDTVSIHGRLTSLILSADGRTLTTTDGTNTAMLWSVRADKAPRPFGRTTLGHGMGLPAVTYTDDGKALITLESSAEATTWDLKDPAKPARANSLRVQDKSLAASRFSPDGRLLATAAEDGVITLTDFSEPTHPKTLARFPLPEEGHSGSYWTGGFAFSPDSTTLAACSNQYLFLWDLHRRTDPTRTAAVYSGCEMQIAFSNDGRTLAATENFKPTSLWNVTNRAKPIKLSHLPGDPGMGDARFSPDGRTLVTSNTDSTAIWDVTDPAIPIRTAILPAGTDLFTISADGRTLATASQYGSLITTWSLADPTAPMRFGGWTVERSAEADSLVLDQLLWSPDGRTLTQVGLDNRSAVTFQSWDQSKSQEVWTNPVGQACATVGRGLTAAEWARYVPVLAYRDSCP